MHSQTEQRPLEDKEMKDQQVQTSKSAGMFRERCFIRSGNNRNNAM